MRDSGVETHRLIGGRYRVGDVLGHSLMSEVRRGEDVRLHRPVAIKLLRDEGDPSSVARFEREAQILASLQHPNIVVVFDTGVDGRDRFIVMELIAGPTLRQVLDEGGLGLERATDIASRLASALGCAHDHGIVHRDVKPSNVLLPSDGGVKLVDMGIARLLSAEALTLTMTALGTARYMSPEQARGERIDARSDIYSLGCVLFEMLTRRTPFDGNPVALSYAHIHTAASRVRSINPTVPAAIDDLVAAMLEKDPADRPQTAGEIERSLAARMIQHRTAPTAPPERVILPPPPMPRRAVEEDPTRRAKARPTAVLALAGLAVAIVVVALAAGRPDGSAGAVRPSAHLGTSATAEQSTPVSTGSPASQQLSPEEAAALVLDAVGAGVAAGEISGHFADEIRHAVDEVLRETDNGEDVEKSLDKFDGLREKVSEAVDKGEITSAARASAIDEALLEFEHAVRETDQLDG